MVHLHIWPPKDKSLDQDLIAEIDLEEFDRQPNMAARDSLTTGTVSSGQSIR